MPACHYSDTLSQDRVFWGISLPATEKTDLHEACVDSLAWETCCLGNLLTYICTRFFVAPALMEPWSGSHRATDRFFVFP